MVCLRRLVAAGQIELESITDHVVRAWLADVDGGRFAAVTIIRALTDSGGNRTRAAANLGVSRHYVLRLIRRFRLEGAVPPARRNWRSPVTIDLAEVRRLSQRHSLARAAEFLGVHFDTLARFADRHGLRFARTTGYNGNGILRRLGKS